MLPMRFFRNRAFAAANAASLLMYFGMFGSIFLLTQFFQTAQGFSPLDSGLRVLPWTAMPLLVAPVAGALSDRIGGRPFIAVGLALQAIGLAWIAAVSEPTVGYGSFVGPFILSGIGMGMFFAPVANIVLLGGSSGRRRQGVGRQQRDPRGGRSARCGRARVDLRALRRLRVLPDLQRRAGSGDLGWRDRRGDRCSARASDSEDASTRRGDYARARARTSGQSG